MKRVIIANVVLVSVVIAAATLNCVDAPRNGTPLPPEAPAPPPPPGTPPKTPAPALPPPPGTPIDPVTLRAWEATGFELELPGSLADGSLPVMKEKWVDRGQYSPERSNSRKDRVGVLFSLNLSIFDSSVIGGTAGGLIPPEPPWGALSGQPHLANLRLSGRVVNDRDLPRLAEFKYLTHLDLASTGRSGNPGVTDAGVEHLVGLPALTSLNLSATGVTNRGVKRLAEREQIIDLSLSSTRVTDEGLKHLARRRNFREINLGGTGITDEGLRHLEGQDNLTSLDLSNTQVTDDGMRFLAGLKNLKRLSLRGTEVSDAGLDRLAGLGQLSSLDVVGARVIGTGLRHFAGRKPLTVRFINSGAQVTDASLKALAANKMLYLLHGAANGAYAKNYPASDEDVTDLRLDGARVTDAGLQYLAGLPNLRYLSLDKTQVRGEGLRHLAGLQNLSRVSLLGASTTEEGLKQLAGLKSLTLLGLDSERLSDAVLMLMAESGRLHALGQAHGEGSQPTKPVEIAYLNLGKTGLTPAALPHLAPLKNLETLHLNEALAKASAWQHFPKLKTLVTYNFKWLSDEQLRALVNAGFFPARPKSAIDVWYRYWTKCDPKEVEHADLRGTKITGEGLKHLAPCKNLSSLTLANSTITDLQHLALLPTLTALDLSGTPVTASDVQHLAGLKSLTTLNLEGTSLTGLGLTHFAGLKSLTTLDLSGTKMTDAGLTHLKGLTRLNYLKLSSNPVTDAGVAELQNALPNCRIVR